MGPYPVCLSGRKGVEFTNKRKEIEEKLYKYSPFKEKSSYNNNQQGNIMQDTYEGIE